MILDKNKTKKLIAFSLIEILISVAIFSVIMVLAARIFTTVLNNQSTSQSDANSQEDVKYFFDVLSREAPLAARNSSSSPICLVDSNYTFATNASSTELYFRSADGDCLAFRTEFDNNVTRLTVKKGDEINFLSSPKVDIRNLRFILSDTGTTTQAVITANVQVVNPNNTTTPAYNIQTSISSRLYE